jgi:hypothetical protein
MPKEILDKIQGLAFFTAAFENPTELDIGQPEGMLLGKPLGFSLDRQPGSSVFGNGYGKPSAFRAFRTGLRVIAHRIAFGANEPGLSRTIPPQERNFQCRTSEN